MADEAAPRSDDASSPDEPTAPARRGQNGLVELPPGPDVPVYLGPLGGFEAAFDKLRERFRSRRG